MMKDTAALARLRRHCDPSGALLSVYVSVPPDPTALRDWRARLHALVATARPSEVGIRPRRRARLARLRIGELGFSRARDWFGHSMLVVASAEGVLEELRLPAPVPDLAVFGRHVYLRATVRSFGQLRPVHGVVVDRPGRAICLRSEPSSVTEFRDLGPAMTC